MSTKKTGSTFKLPKDVKMVMANCSNPQMKAEFKELMIDAEVTYKRKREGKKEDTETA